MLFSDFEDPPATPPSSFHTEPGRRPGKTIIWLMWKHQTFGVHSGELLILCGVHLETAYTLWCALRNCLYFVVCTWELLILCGVHPKELLILCGVHSEELLILCGVHSGELLILCGVHPKELLILCGVHSGELLILCDVHSGTAYTLWCTP